MSGPTGPTAGPTTGRRRRGRAPVLPALALIVGLLVTLPVGCAPGATSDAPSVASLDDATTGTPTSTPSEPSVDGDPAGLSACMEEQGAPIPPPTSSDGEFTYTYPDGVSRAEADAAFAACGRYLPGGGAPPDADPEQLARLRELAACMRDHGVEGFPDPNPEGVVDMPAGSGVDPSSPEYTTALDACTESRAPAGEGQG
ncbi:hypothetical protein [Cellulosimicrobium protaetiae]|uniref:Uncharacterized protein n=1 Tax=Cellulosimicrobium protaetiae TaxID=2587808 RepID=A0A6M5UEK5_9MICO|nr:hypothetical protein [Cellulosimicrobium protaetiae]QJW35528.1 hypothetical protein FIC82_004240 [Cellulosimicrobium protaetiae]